MTETPLYQLPVGDLLLRQALCFRKGTRPFVFSVGGGRRQLPGALFGLPELLAPPPIAAHLLQLSEPSAESFGLWR